MKFLTQKSKLSFCAIIILKQETPRGAVWPQGHNLDTIGRGP